MRPHLQQTYRILEQIKRVQKSRRLIAENNLENKLPPINLDKNHKELLKTNPDYRKLTQKYQNLIKKFYQKISFIFN